MSTSLPLPAVYCKCCIFDDNNRNKLGQGSTCLIIPFNLTAEPCHNKSVNTNSNGKQCNFYTHTRTDKETTKCSINCCSCCYIAFALPLPLPAAHLSLSHYCYLQARQFFKCVSQYFALLSPGSVVNHHSSVMTVIIIRTLYNTFSVIACRCVAQTSKILPNFFLPFK